MSLAQAEMEAGVHLPMQKADSIQRRLCHLFLWGRCALRV